MWITMTPRSRRCFITHTEYTSITPSEKACLSVSRRRPCPNERRDPLWREQGNLFWQVVRSQTLNTHRLELFWTDRKIKSSPNVRPEIKKHEFQANYDRRSVQKLSEIIESQQEELHCAQAEELQRRGQQLLHALLLQQNSELREAHNKSLNEMEELKRFQGSTFDTVARRRLVEDQDTILELTGKIQELQNEINCMNDSRDFQDAESIRSENSHVASRSVSFPPHPIPEGMLSRSVGMPSRKQEDRQAFGTHMVYRETFLQIQLRPLQHLIRRN